MATMTRPSCQPHRSPTGRPPAVGGEQPHALPLPAALAPEDAAALADLYRRGTPANTIRAWERDLAYIAAWKAAVFAAPLAWPEAGRVALRFVLDHSLDLADRQGSSAHAAACALIAAGLRRSLACPAPATLDRRIASWRAFHRMRGLASPFETPLLAQARARARRAAARAPAPKSPHPITRPLLEALLASCDDSPRGLRDRALLSLAWASGGRRRSEIAGLRREDADVTDYPRTGVIGLRLVATKTTGPASTPPLLVKGRAAAALMHWIEAAGIAEGPLFRPVSRAGRVLARPLSPDGVRVILRHRLTLAGHDPGFATPHGLRSGFLTQAALDGAPLAAAMRLSLHRSAAQAQRYYADLDLAENPAADLLD